MTKPGVQLIPGLLLLIACDTVLGDELHYRPGGRGRLVQPAYGGPGADGGTGRTHTPAGVGEWSVDDLGPAWNRTDVALSPNGHGAVIWADAGAGVFVKTFAPEGGWSEPVRASVATSRVLSPSVAINDAGHVVAAYREATVAFARSTIDGGASWSEEKYLGGSGAAEISRPDFVLAGDDRAFGIVSIYRTGNEVTTVDGSMFDLQANTLATHPISTADNGTDAGGQIALYRGQPVVVWQEVGDSPGIWWMEGAKAGARLQLAAAGTAPAVAASDEGGAVIAAWEQSEDGASSIWAARRIGDAPFETPMQVSANAGAAQPSVAIDATGRAHVLWEQATEFDSTEISAATFDPETGGWSAPEVLSPPDERAIRPRVVVEAGGHALAAWIELDVAETGDITSDVVTQRFVPAEGWDAESRATFTSSAQPNGAIDEVALAIDASARALVTWWDDSGARVARWQ